MKAGKDKKKEKTLGIQSYKELEIWQLGMDLAEDCYRVTKGFPKEEQTERISRMLSGLRKALQKRL